MNRGDTWSLSLPAVPGDDSGGLRAEQGVGRIKLTALVAAGLLTNFTVGLVGAFPVGEFVLAATLVYVLLSMVLDHAVPGSLLRSRLLWTFVACQAVALLGYMASDVYWGSSANDMARGWARAIFLGVDVLAVAFLFDVPGRSPWVPFLCFEAGYALGGAAATLTGDVLFGDYWKFGWASPVTITVLLLAPRLGFWFAQLACLALCAVHVALDFRSLAAICLVVPFLMVVQRLSAPQRIAAVVFCVGLAAAALAIHRHPVGPAADNVRASRSDIERGAMVQAAWEGFLRSPWLGNGSWFSKSNVIQEFYAIRYERSVVDGIGSFEQDEADAPVAIHSQILAALAEGGLLGGVFFVFYGAMLLWGLRVIVLTQPWQPWSHLGVFFLLLKLCDLATSPFSGAHRVLIAVGVGWILLLWHRMPPRRVVATVAGGFAAIP